MRVLAALAIAVAVTACETVGIPPVVPAGQRPLVIGVENSSNVPARLLVAGDRGVAGVQVGTASPAVVPAHASAVVTFTVPDTSSWAIFVNPGPAMGPLVTAADIPADASGTMPFKIVVDARGNPGAQMGELPGWFGNP